MTPRNRPGVFSPYRRPDAPRYLPGERGGVLLGSALFLLLVVLVGLLMWGISARGLGW